MDTFDVSLDALVREGFVDVKTNEEGQQVYRLNEKGQEFFRKDDASE